MRALNSLRKTIISTIEEYPKTTLALAAIAAAGAACVYKREQLISMLLHAAKEKVAVRA